ncbi:HD domain-containing protein [Candidatus Saganbacteria bacterium]|nr:HD domain-containing protein [Candidatus Saganbacteria bacterium]
MPIIGAKSPKNVFPAPPRAVRPGQQRAIQELVKWASDPRLFFAVSAPPASPDFRRFEALKEKLRQGYLHPEGGLQQELTASLPDFTPLDHLHHMANYAHAGKPRDTGEPYIIHPYEVCEAMANDGLIEIVSQAGGMGHDVVEETENWSEANRILPEDIRFDLVSKGVEAGTAKEIADLIDGLTKVRKWGRSRTNRLVQSHMKMIEITRHDPRVMIIKLYDRLCNSRSFNRIDKEKAKRIAQETLDIMVPFAKGLGMWELRRELMENSFEVLYEEYATIKAFVEKRIERDKKAIEDAKARLAQMFGSENVRYTPRSAAEIFDQYLAIKKKKPAEEVDLEVLIKGIHSFAVVRENNDACFGALGTLHSPDCGFIPVPETFVDHIAEPTENLYEALHDIVVVPHLGHVLVKIMTPAMERLSRLGAVSFYDPRHPNPQWYKKIIDSYPWLKQYVDDLRSRGKMTEHDIREATQGAVSYMFVFTPMGEAIKIRFDSTVLDFAFRVHKKLGLKAIGARVMRRRRAFVAGLDFQLSSGDQVEVIRDPNLQRQLTDLQKVRTDRAKRAIRSYLRSKERSQLVSEGANAISKEMEKLGLYLSFEDLSSAEFRSFRARLLAFCPSFPQKEGEKGTRQKAKTLADVAYLVAIGENFKSEEASAPQVIALSLKSYLDRLDQYSRKNPEKARIFSIRFELPNRPGIWAAVSSGIASLNLDIPGNKVRYKIEDGVKIADLTLEVEIFNDVHKLQVKKIIRDINAAVLSTSDDQAGDP